MSLSDFLSVLDGNILAFSHSNSGLASFNFESELVNLFEYNKVNFGRWADRLDNDKCHEAWKALRQALNYRDHVVRVYGQYNEQYIEKLIERAIIFLTLAKIDFERAALRCNQSFIGYLFEGEDRLSVLGLYETRRGFNRIFQKKEAYHNASESNSICNHEKSLQYMLVILICHNYIGKNYELDLILLETTQYFLRYLNVVVEMHKVEISKSKKLSKSIFKKIELCNDYYRNLINLFVRVIRELHQPRDIGFSREVHENLELISSLQNQFSL